MKPASNQLLKIPPKFEVMLDIGSYSNSFSYIDGKNLGVEIGDIVSVPLKGRLLNGLVIAKDDFSRSGLAKRDFFGEQNFKYLSIEMVVQKKIIQEWWKEWIEALALFYKVSELKMYKTAFPPGWIGKHKKNSVGLKNQIWIEPNTNIELNKDQFTIKEFSLINSLNHKGNWQSELIKSGFNFTLISSMVQKNLIVKTKRKKLISPKLSSLKNDFAHTKNQSLPTSKKVLIKK